MALQESLNDYYDNYVYIAPDRMTSAKAVAEEVGDKLLEFLKQKPTIPVSIHYVIIVYIATSILMLIYIT